MAATTTTSLGTASAALHSAPPSGAQRSLPWAVLLPLLTASTLFIDGYHPLAEDGGLYVAGIEYRLDPTLFPHYTAFVTEHLHYSLFAPMIAAGVRLTHLPLAWALLGGYVFSLWFVLYAGLMVLRRCTQNPVAQLGGIALFAAWSTLPVAGTSLLLIDPYLTARSLSTPLSLVAIAFALDGWKTSGGPSRSAMLCALSLLGAVLLHPLMGACALAVVVLLRLVRRPRPLVPCIAFAAGALLSAALVHGLASPDPPAVIAASLSRYYWFLSQWEWYELCGLIGPVAILLLLMRRGSAPTPGTRALCVASIAAGTTAVLIALCFAHEHSTTYLIARLQPLRVFLLIYAVMTLLLGASLTASLHQFTNQLPRRGLRLAANSIPLVVFLLSGFIFFNAQRETFPATQPIEWPWAQPTNAWSRAFLWVRDNTPRDALFALDADYITTPREDAQTFRATALRSSLPDFSKDGGEASIAPSLTPLWQQALTAQFAIQSGTHLIAKASLSRQNDAERDAHLRPLGVTWIVLHADALTAHACPYDNGTVKVCRLVP